MMNKERLEYLVNEMYHNYLEQDEAQELTDYINDLEQRIDKLEKENEKLRKENTEYQDEIFARDNSWYDMQD